MSGTIIATCPARSRPADMPAYQGRGVMLTQGESSEAVLANPVTPNFFKFLGVRAELGRALRWMRRPDALAS